MRHTFAIFVLLCLSFFLSPFAYAIENPLAVNNNKIGIHILFPDEIDKAAQLINSNGGDWGYVVIPIQSGDKDINKWQAFFDKAKKLHVIPIIRLATEGDYFNTKVWRIPTDADVLDFANFLNSLSWPTKNRYIIVYNEVNRGDEWGGVPDPSAYAQILSYASDVFKQRSQDFFIISAGMDNAAATTPTSMNEYQYLAAMNTAVPGVFDKIDGIGSHSYPNPAFSQPPTAISPMGVASFQFEKNLIEGHAKADLPVFITETGWDQHVVGEQTAGSYLSTALQNVWSRNDIVVVAPFLLQAGGGPFVQFSFLGPDGAPNLVSKALMSIPKEKGAPIASFSSTVLAAAVTTKSVPDKTFENSQQNSLTTLVAYDVKTVLKWLLHLQ
ncbi:MAG TPA: hypothetical protein VLB73_01675 [Patescibacteria group bacterium]|nr:hypothetical protein [Patescibacteria group bacterium]